MRKAFSFLVAMLAVVVVAGSCGGPSGGSTFRTIFIRVTAGNDISLLDFVVNTDSGSFEDQCSRGAVIEPEDPPCQGCPCNHDFCPCDPEQEVCTNVTGANQLEVRVAHDTADGIDVGNIIAVCKFKADEGNEPEFTVEIRECVGADVDPCRLRVSVSQEPVEPECGNEIVETGEDCDEGDGNGNSNPCTAECQDAVCGDGETCSADDCDTGPSNEPEECDDGNSIDTDSCTNDCETN